MEKANLSNSGQWPETLSFWSGISTARNVKDALAKLVNSRPHVIMTSNGQEIAKPVTFFFFSVAYMFITKVLHRGFISFHSGQKNALMDFLISHGYTVSSNFSYLPIREVKTNRTLFDIYLIMRGQAFFQNVWKPFVYSHVFLLCVWPVPCWLVTALCILENWHFSVCEVSLFTSASLFKEN